jgi:capsid assembly protease
MSIADVLNSPWLITPEKFIQMRDIYLAHLRGEKADLEKIEAALGRALDNKREGYSVNGGVAVIPVEGVLSKKMNLFTRISGGTSTQALQRDLSDAAADPMVHSILLLVDSPGGEVDGTQAAANLVRAIRDEGKKPIVALADGLMASAAYWIASAASDIYMSGDTDAIGSIGVVTSHTDYSKAEEQRGIKVTEITAGKYKRVVSTHEPLTDEGRADIQAKVDYLYSIFVDEVAANRGVTVKTVLNKMADGRVFLGKQAIEAGLVDGMSSVAELIADLNKRFQKNTAAKTTVAPKSTATSATASVTPSADNYMERMRRYMAEGMTQFEAMQKAVREQQFAEALAYKSPEHQQQNENSKSTKGEAMNSNSQPGNSQATTDPVKAARDLADRAQAYRLDQESKGNRVTLIDAVKAVSNTGSQTSDGPLEIARALAQKATAYRIEQQTIYGRRLTIAQAVAEVSAQSESNAPETKGVRPVAEMSDEENIAQAKEISSKAQLYLAGQHRAGNTRMTVADAVAHVSKQQK